MDHQQQESITIAIGYPIGLQPIENHYDDQDIIVSILYKGRSILSSNMVIDIENDISPSLFIHQYHKDQHKTRMRVNIDGIKQT